MLIWLGRVGWPVHWQHTEKCQQASFHSRHQFRWMFARLRGWINWTCIIVPTLLRGTGISLETVYNDLRQHLRGLEFWLQSLPQRVPKSYWVPGLDPTSIALFGMEAVVWSSRAISTVNRICKVLPIYHVWDILFKSDSDTETLRASGTIYKIIFSIYFKVVLLFAIMVAIQRQYCRRGPCAGYKIEIVGEFQI